MYERPLYYEKIRPFIGKPLIKVITGIRRCGKSTMMLLIEQELLQQKIDPQHIIYLNFESLRNEHLRSSRPLYDYIAERMTSIEGKAYIFFDEIQLVEGWEDAVNSITVDFSVDLYLTGSNSELLASEISSLLTGRFVHFRMQVLSFTEMLTFRKTFGESEEDLLWLYIRRGGFPAIHLSKEYDERSSYTILNSIFDSIILRDVVQRYKIRNVELLRRVLYFVVDTVGSPISAKRIADFFKSQARSVDMNTVHTYLDALESSYIVTRVQRYDIKGKEILKTQEKYYLADTGLQHAAFGYRDRHISGVLENIVHNELVSRGYGVYIGKIDSLEIDFIGEKAQQTIYVQVAYRLDSEKTIQREFAPLLAIRDSYPKFVVTMDSHFSDTIDGVRHVSVHQFLTDKQLF